MSTAYEDRLRQGKELRRMRSEHTVPGSPCERCKRESCPELCFPRLDYNKRRRFEEREVSDND